jgi:ribosomal protein L37AE/L43A
MMTNGVSEAVEDLCRLREQAILDRDWEKAAQFHDQADALVRRSRAPKCPNCTDGRMTVNQGGCLWCDRCESDFEKAAATADLPETMLDRDLFNMTREQLIVAMSLLRNAVRAQRDATGHNLCWHQPDLWNLLPEKVIPQPTVPAWPQFMRGCVQYRASLDAQLANAPRSDGSISRESVGEDVSYVPVHRVC